MAATLAVTGDDVTSGGKGSDGVKVEAVQWGTTAPTQGQPVYMDATDSNKHKVADNNTEAASIVAGFCVSNDAVADGYGFIQTAGPYVHGGTTTTNGQQWYLGASGAIVDEDSLGAGDFTSKLFVTTDASTADILIDNTRVSQ